MGWRAPAALGGRALTVGERYARGSAIREAAPLWLRRRLPRDLKRYSLKLGGEDSVRKRQAVAEARRLGWLKKPVMDDD